MKLLTLLLGVTLMIFFFPKSQSKADVTQSSYDFSFSHLGSEDTLALSDYRGKVILIVNTASKCGFTSQYAGLETLYGNYKDQGLVIIGVPSNDFGGQEPGTNEEISRFCKLNYGVSFPMANKEVVSGENANPFYQWAKESLGFGTAPKWNFHKYLINKKGELIDYFNSTTAPDNSRMKQAIESALKESL